MPDGQPVQNQRDILWLVSDALAVAADWWRSTQRPSPQSPLLVVWCADDPAAVSRLPKDYGRQWPDRFEQSGTGRLCEYLGVRMQVADDELDLTRTDLILVAEVGRGLTTTAVAQAVRAYDQEPQLLTGRGSGVSDVAWMSKVVQVRERAKYDSAPVLAEVSHFLQRCREAEVPVLLDGVVSAAAASLCAELPHFANPILGDEPAQRLFLDRMDVAAWSTGTVGAGMGSLTGLGLLRLALAAHP